MMGILERFRHKSAKPVPLADAVLVPVKTGKLITRKAERKDVDALVGLSRRFHEEGMLRDIPFSERKLRVLADKAIGDDPSQIAIVVELQGRIVGAIYALIGEYYVGEGALVTTVHGFYVEQDIRSSILSGKVAVRLIRTMQKWSKHMGAKHTLFHITSGVRPEKTDLFMRKLGMKNLGGNHVIVIP